MIFFEQKKAVSLGDIWTICTGRGWVLCIMVVRLPKNRGGACVKVRVQVRVWKCVCESACVRTPVSTAYLALRSRKGKKARRSTKKTKEEKKKKDFPEIMLKKKKMLSKQFYLFFFSSSVDPLSPPSPKSFRRIYTKLPWSPTTQATRMLTKWFLARKCW